MHGEGAAVRPNGGTSSQQSKVPHVCVRVYVGVYYLVPTTFFEAYGHVLVVNPQVRSHAETCSAEGSDLLRLLVPQLADAISEGQ